MKSEPARCDEVCVSTYIYKSLMKASVNPVDQHVSEEKKRQDTSNELKPAYKRQKDMAESRFSS